MRLSNAALLAGVFAVAGVISVIGARAAVMVVERSSVSAVQGALIDQGQEWASVLGDGLQVILEGEAPTEAVRFRAITIAGTMVDASRVIDNMDVEESQGVAAPEFSVEILRNDSGVSLIGLLPASSDRETLTQRIERIAAGQPLTDLMETADYPRPDTWSTAMSFAIASLETLPRSKISVKADLVEITAIADDATQKRAIEAELLRKAPTGIEVVLSITAPRPVITPFTTRFIKDADGARFPTCAADTEVAQARILVAAQTAGAPESATCQIGLGVPSRTWSDAVVMSIAAVDQLGGGTVTLADTDVSLVALEGTDPALFERVAGELENTLPGVFALEATLPRTQEASEEGPPAFTVTLSPEGSVQLRGRVSGELLNTTAENFARARFGLSDVTMGTRVTEGLPGDWTIRVLAGIEALSLLSNGAVVVEPSTISVRGNTGNPEAQEEVSRPLIQKLGDAAEFSVDVAYKEELDPVAGLPTPEECIARIGTVTENRKITFEPGSATIDAQAIGIIDDIAEILRDCLDLRLEIAGYTDSQGREEMNQQLSQQRAESVLAALRQRRVPTGTFTAVGFGEAEPIADNDTEEGREANRRIEFHLIEPEPVDEEPTTLEQVEAAPEEGEAEAEAAETEDEQN